MPLPKPEIGLIVHYSYRFRQTTSTAMAGGKDRPCLIVSVNPDVDEPNAPGVLYLPITHSAPHNPGEALEIPPDARYAAGLDGYRQWVHVGEGNLDNWAYDVSMIPGRQGRYHYGFMPPRFFAQIQTRFANLYAARRFDLMPRNEEE